MVARDPNTRDLTQQKLCVADDILVWPVHERGELVYRIEITEQHRFFRIGYEEYVLISLFDGGTTIPQACGLAAARLGSRAPTAAQAGVIARWLLKNKLAYLPGDGPPNRKAEPAEATSGQTPARRLLSRLNPFWMKVPLPRGERMINACAKLCRPALSTQAIVFGMFLILIGAAVLFTRLSEFVASTSHLIHPSNWLWLIATWLVLKLIHELAHAVACQRLGGTVRESGVVLVLFAPLAYVDVTSCWRMNSRWSRIAVASAGMYVEILIAAIAGLLWAIVDDPHAQFLLHNLVLAAGLSTLLFNANVLMRFDGYFILADLIDVPNLYGEASAAVQRLARRAVTGERTIQDSLSGWRRYFVLAYGLAALVWRVTICVSLGIAASTMLAGAGIALAVLGIFLWCSRPLKQLSRYAADLRSREPGKFVRGLLVGATGMGLLAGVVIWMPIPTSIHAPAVARYLPETTVRSRTSGFVAKVHVDDGAEVRRGDLLLELQNRELSNQLQQLRISSAQNAIRLRQATEQHDAGARHVLMENQKSLAEQIEQLGEQASGLSVVAPRDGRVIKRGLQAMIGTYVHEGDVILLVASERDKEIVALVGQDVIEDVRPLVGTEIHLHDAAFVTAAGRFDRVEPRADDRLSEASLAATEGGSLPVETLTGQQGQDQLRLLEPHFRGRITVDAGVAQRVAAGMRVRASLGYRDDSLVVRARQAFRRLWHAAHDTARRN